MENQEKSLILDMGMFLLLARSGGATRDVPPRCGLLKQALLIGCSQINSLACWNAIPIARNPRDSSSMARKNALFLERVSIFKLSWFQLAIVSVFHCGIDRNPTSCKRRHLDQTMRH